MDVLTPMLDALELEVRAIRVKGRGGGFEVTRGRFDGRIAGRYVYSFRLPDSRRITDDTPVRAEIGDQTISGVIVSLRDRTLRVALEEFVGAEITIARILTDDSFLLDRLREVLGDLNARPLPFNHTIADRALGEGPGYDCSRTAAPPGVLEGLHPEKVRCVETALGSSVTYVWGPPGTGKTTAVGRIVKAFYLTGRSVLLVSNTNVAVDTALEKICEALSGDPGLEEGRILRLGLMTKDELRSSWGTRVDPVEVAARMSGDLGERRSSLLVDQKRLRSKHEALRAEIRPWELADVARERLERLRTELEAAGKAVHDAVQTRDRRARELTEAQLAVAAPDAGPAVQDGQGSFFGPQFRVDEARRLLDHAEATLRSCADRKHAAQVEEAEAELELQERDAATGTDSERATLKAAIDKVEADLEAIATEVAEIEAKLEVLRLALVRGARVIATTAYQAYLRSELVRSFDAVIIDEASMLPLPLTFFAAGLAGTRVVVAGDFRQLPAIVQSKDQRVLRWVKRGVFLKAGIGDALDPPAQLTLLSPDSSSAEPPESLVALETQFRMHPRICELVSDLSYGGRLRTDDEVAEIRLGGSSLSDAPIVLVDSSDLSPWASCRVGTWSRYNIVHAALVRNVVMRVLDPGADRAPPSVGIVVPYVAQSLVVNTALLDALEEDDVESTRAATVHRLQGSEKDITIVDLTDSPGVPLGRWMKANSPSDEGARLLNVALSRSREQLVVIANRDHFNKKAPRGGVLRRALRQISNVAEVFSGEEVLGWGPDALPKPPDGQDGGSVPLSDPTGIQIFDDATFYPAFRRDLDGAEDHVVLLSPFRTETGVGRWTAPLVELGRKGVNVRVVTRPFDDDGGLAPDSVVDLFATLRADGVAVDPRAGMHEKVAIIDGRVLWVGSLNILSHNQGRTRELMFRIVDAGLVERTAEFLMSRERRRIAKGSMAALFAEPENPVCAACSRPMIWIQGKKGRWVGFKCPGCGSSLRQ